MSNKYKSEHLKNQADRLLNDDILNLAIAEARNDALELLLRKDLNTHEALEAQALARALDDLNMTLNRYILAEV
jgi:hypothetical protein